MKTELAKRSVWYDGVVEVTPNQVESLLLLGTPVEKICVTEVNDDVTKFNSLSGVKLCQKKDAKIDLSWQIPKEYQEIDIEEYFLLLFKHKVALDDPNFERREIRLANEIEEFKRRGHFDVLRAIIYTFDVLKKNKVVWGVGRGSSCASYLLYLLGVHLVDPVLYDIPVSEFLHD